MMTELPPLREYHVFTRIFNPSRGMVKIFLCSVHARNRKDAVKYGTEHLEVNENGEMEELILKIV